LHDGNKLLNLKEELMTTIRKGRQGRGKQKKRFADSFGMTLISSI
jgi:hypothetical protein